MVSVSELRNDFDKLVNSRGEQVRFRFYTQVIGGGGSYYDDDVALSKSGNDIMFSGIKQNISLGGGGGFRSHEAILMEQGKLIANDLKLYITGSHDVSGASIKIGLGGSPPTGEYRIIEDGVISYPLMGSNIYHKLFLRKLTNGSLFGE